jgi:C-terminal processing protease CtpA/Prc
MKKADNFDAKQWLVENKITTQSRLNEAKDPDSVVSQEARDMFYNAVAKVMKDLYQADIMDNDIIDDYLSTEGGLLGDAIEAFLHPEDLDESRLNENEIPGVNVEVDDDMITLSDDSGDYDGFIEDNGTVSFTVTNDEEEFDEDNWKDILGDDHVFVKIANSINTDVEALGDYVMITVKADDLK